MKLKGHVPRVLGKSRFCRRLHRLADFVLALFFYLGKRLKDVAGAATYRLGSFPVQVCDSYVDLRVNFKNKHFINLRIRWRIPESNFLTNCPCINGKIERLTFGVM